MATVRIRNLGPFDRDIKPGGALGDALATVPVGGEVEVSESLAASLLEQVDAWGPVSKSKSAAAADAPVEG